MKGARRLFSAFLHRATAPRIIGPGPVQDEPRGGGSDPRKMAMWDEVKAVIESNRSFVISSHVNPDGDSIGSALGVYECLKALGKDAVVAMNDAIPGAYTWLDPDGEILAPASDADIERLGDADVAVIVDANSWDRLGRLRRPLEESAAVKIVIDHHPYNELITPFSVIETKASSAAELVYDLIESLGAPLSSRAADALYTGILTDTVSFRFARSAPCAHVIAARLLSRGVDPSRVYDQIYNNNTGARTRLMGRALSGIQFSGCGRVAWLTVTRSMIEETGALSSDTSGFVDVTMTIAGTEIGIIFVEARDGTVQISMRSRPETDVNQVAVGLGGGGHKNAAGAVFNGTLEQAVRTVTAAAVTAL